MESLCPTCHRPIAPGDRRQRRRQLVQQISALQREISSLQLGAVHGAIQQQSPAPSCTICEQAAPGKPGQPTPVADLIRPVRQRLDEVERALIRLDRGE